MNIQELTTAVTHKLPIKIVVLNNCFLGMVRQWQNMFFDNRLSGVDLEGSPDFVKLAEAFGIWGRRLDGPDQLAGALDEAFAQPGPALIAAPVDYGENQRLTERLGNLVCPI